jgi:hypothetical protein
MDYVKPRCAEKCGSRRRKRGHEAGGNSETAHPLAEHLLLAPLVTQGAGKEKTKVLLLLLNCLARNIPSNVFEFLEDTLPPR